MSKRLKMGLLIGCTVLSLAAITTSAILLLAKPSQFDIPTSPAIVSAEAYWHMSGYRERIIVYQDGEVRCVIDRGLRIPTAEHPAVRTWKVGSLSNSDLQALSALVDNPDFATLESEYYYSGNPSSDLWLTVVVDTGTSTKAVTARSFMSPDGGKTYPGMPYPMDDIYARLHDIAENRTVQVAVHDIQEGH